MSAPTTLFSFGEFAIQVIDTRAAGMAIQWYQLLHVGCKYSYSTQGLLAESKELADLVMWMQAQRELSLLSLHCYRCGMQVSAEWIQDVVSQVLM